MIYRHITNIVIIPSCTILKKEKTHYCMWFLFHFIHFQRLYCTPSIEFANHSVYNGLNIKYMLITWLKWFRFHFINRFISVNGPCNASVFYFFNRTIILIISILISLSISKPKNQYCPSLLLDKIDSFYNGLILFRF